jgi:hypothetical protein
VALISRRVGGNFDAGTQRARAASVDCLGEAFKQLGDGSKRACHVDASALPPELSDVGQVRTSAPGSVDHVRRMLVRLFGWLEENERISVSPMRGVKAPRARVDTRPRRTSRGR